MLHVLVQDDRLLCDQGAETVVPWWSFGKTVISAALLVQVQNGLLALDDPVFEWPFTLRQLLRHQAGLADYGQLPEYHAAVERGEAAWKDEDMLLRVQAADLGYPPGASWCYSNVGYFYARRIIERSAGEEFGAALRRLVFRPLGLEDVRLLDAKQDFEGAVLGIPSTYDPRWVYHGLMVGPLAEAAFMLDRLMAGQLISSSMLAAMMDAYPVGPSIPGRPWRVPKYGLGVMVGETHGGRSVAGHTGGGPGSCVAVYRNLSSPSAFTAAAFALGADAGAVERQAMEADPPLNA
ncbi:MULTISPECIES: serine hydrolase [unclassified Polaromonas]|uniref:serine hydrolase domain-containing protein n=1 Tax=unclassified Polaromonas TaxID=2638319 RepID=UPI000F08DB85|nr:MULTISPECIES: serine hydrolase domain-containing protein [unclassified Polaromonas]AYQ26832.1 class A beta-lactamase-related serine hydrolase [Polaromonas sp. SP1]QGJ18323.1 serine hydrolase [Polaromonas sp. Pch-P]